MRIGMELFITPETVTFKNADCGFNIYVIIPGHTAVVSIWFDSYEDAAVSYFTNFDNAGSYFTWTINDGDTYVTLYWKQEYSAEIIKAMADSHVA